jgi:hypothetical protein
MMCFIFTERICVRTCVLLYSFIYTSILITCKETQKWREQLFDKEWLQLDEEIAYRKLFSNAKTLEVENLNKFLHTGKGKARPRTGREDSEEE